jgi:HEAT repeat protein
MRAMKAALAAALVSGLVVGSAVAQKGKGGAAAKKPPPGSKTPASKKTNTDVDAAKAALTGSDEDAAVKAAGDLGSSDDAAAHDALLDALATGLDPQIAEVAVQSVAKHPADADAATLAFYARYRQIDVRAAAAQALGAYDGAVANRALIAALGDPELRVRMAASQGAADGHNKATKNALMALFLKGDTASMPGLTALADADLSRQIGEQLGVVPDDLLAQTLGGILLRKDFGPDTARLEVVRAIAKIKGETATKALQDYIDGTPEKPPRQSRKEAVSLIADRDNGGDQ